MNRLAPNIYVSTEYPGVNVGFIVVPGGAIAVDAPTLPSDAHAWRQRIVETAGGPILYVILTDAHPDRLLSAGLLDAQIVASRNAYERATTYTAGFWRGVVDSWAQRYPEEASNLRAVSPALPEIMFSERLTLHVGEESITVQRVAGGSSDSAWVYLREEDVLFSGDVVVVGSHPHLEASADTKRWLNTLTRIRRKRFSEITITILPGRGPVCDQFDSGPVSEYVAFVRRRVRSLLRTGHSRLDRAVLVGELMPFFPVADGERDLVRRRVKAGVDRVCEELMEID